MASHRVPQLDNDRLLNTRLTNQHIIHKIQKLRAVTCHRITFMADSGESSWNGAIIPMTHDEMDRTPKESRASKEDTDSSPRELVWAPADLRIEGYQVIPTVTVNIDCSDAVTKVPTAVQRPVGVWRGLNSLDRWPIECASHDDDPSQINIVRPLL